MYDMKKFSQRKVMQTQAVAYLDAVFNNTSLRITEQDDGIIQLYCNVATKAEVYCSTIYEMMDENLSYYDSIFPKKVKITKHRVGRISLILNLSINHEDNKLLQ